MDFKSQLHPFPNPNVTKSVTLWPSTNCSAHELSYFRKYTHSSYLFTGFISLHKTSPAFLPGRLYGTYITKLDICLLGLGALTCLGCMSVLAELATGLQELSQFWPPLLSLPPAFIHQDWTIKMPSGNSNPPISRCRYTIHTSMPFFPLRLLNLTPRN